MTSYGSNEIKFRVSFKKSLKRIDKEDQIKIKEFLDKLKNIEDPISHELIDVKKLKKLSGKQDSIYRYRIGQYRIIAEVTNENHILILLIDIFHRQQGYGNIH